MKTIPVPTSKKKFFRQFLELLHSIPPFHNLKPRELDVLGEVMYMNNKFRDTDSSKRYLIVFSTEVRKEMRESLNVSEEVFNNNLSALRKNRVLNKNNRLIPFLENLLFDKEFILQFNFQLTNA